jgi:MFS family permease
MNVRTRVSWRIPSVDPGMRMLILATLLNTLGYQVFVPVLPLFFGKLGASPELIGLVAGIGLLCYGLGQYPSGLLADRFDRRAVAAFATIAYGSLFIAYLFPLALPVAIVIRFVHAFVGGFFTPVSLALAADLAPEDKVSRNYGMWQATTMAGFLIGPLIGGIVATYGLDLVFALAAALCFSAVVPVLRIDRSRTSGARAAASVAAPVELVASRLVRLLPAILAGAAPEYLAGAITGVWAIYLTGIGGEPWQVGLSFTLFALPAVLLSVWFGGLVDRRGARLVMASALIVIAATMPAYALFATVPVALALLAFTGIAVAAERPVVYTEVVRVATPSEYARAQSVLQIGLMVAQSLGAIVSGFLYGLSPGLVFAGVAVACLLSLLAVPRLQERRALVRT